MKYYDWLHELTPNTENDTYTTYCVKQQYTQPLLHRLRYLAYLKYCFTVAKHPKLLKHLHKIRCRNCRYGSWSVHQDFNTYNYQTAKQTPANPPTKTLTPTANCTICKHSTNATTPKPQKRVEENR